VPDGPPARFRWRRVLHEVAAAEGPERIALEWWRDARANFIAEESEFALAGLESSHFLQRTGSHFAGQCSTGCALTRDYFRIETRAGLRVWLYREGLYGRETTQPRWFLHGLFG
jgi:protein ImuB